MGEMVGLASSRRNQSEPDRHSTEECDDMMDTNVRSTFLFTRHTVPVMLEQRQGNPLDLSHQAWRFR
jgi:NADP-dependent 3-hydroxy acid dehydrogenase YdfG